MNYLLALLTLVWSGVTLRYDVNEVLRCSYDYTDPNERRWCIVGSHYRQLWLECEFPDTECPQNCPPQN